MINDKLLFEQYEWLVPTQPVSFSKVIEEIVKKFDAQTMESSEIPNICAFCGAERPLVR